jgi:hypothetical protein
MDDLPDRFDAVYVAPDGLGVIFGPSPRDHDDLDG